ncbi:MAG TPA: biotin--[acetyl-CoA-carboxylase] ligase [Solirubrobacteraceae bacterium]|nr:biotin--[acetyl-CoA-carboxylase] ligase [Solirubrobacteraceae bacterium]
MSRRTSGQAITPITTLGRPRVHLRRTDSTNDRARALAIAGAPHGTLVSARQQTAGRGRQGRRWSAPAGSSVLASLVLRSPPPLLPLLAAVAVCDVIGERALIKWPNDIVVPASDVEGCGEGSSGLAKLAGILVESRPQEGWAVLGIGINVAVRLDELPAELQAGQHRGADAHADADADADADKDVPGAGNPLPAATLGLKPSAVEPTLARLLDALALRLAEGAQETLIAWRARDALLGRDIAWTGGVGRASGIDGDGRLLVALAGGGQAALASGEVHLVLIR